MEVPSEVPQSLRWLWSPRTPGWTIAGYLLVGLLVVTLATRSYYAYDDWVIINLLHGQPLTSDLVLRSMWGHMMPGLVALSWVLVNGVGLHWIAPTLIVLLSFAAVVAAVCGLVDTAIGRRRVGILAGVATACSLPFLPQAMWLQAVLSPVVPTAAGLLAMLAASRWDRTRKSTILLAALALAYGVALSFFEKSLVFSVFIAVWLTLVVDAGLSARRRLAHMIDRWPVWLVLMALSILHLSVYLRGNYGETMPLADAGTTLQATVRTGLLGLTPAVFGVDLTQPLWTRWTLPIAIVSGVAMAVVVAATCLSSAKARSVWLGVLGMFVTSIVPLALGRAGLLGVNLGLNQRYLTEVMAVLLAGLAIASFHACADSTWSLRAREVTKRLGVAIVLLSMAAWSATMLHWATTFGPVQSRQWVTQMRATWPSDPVVRLVDVPYRFTFAFEAQFPYNMSSRIVPFVAPGPVTWVASTRDAWYVQESGTVSRVGVWSYWTDTERHCLAPGTPLDVPIGSESVDFLYLTYDSGSDTTLSVQVAGTADALGSPDQGLTDGVLPLEHGSSDALQFLKDAQSVRVVRLVTQSADVCITSVQRVVVTPA